MYMNAVIIYEYIREIQKDNCGLQAYLVIQPFYEKCIRLQDRQLSKQILHWKVYVMNTLENLTLNRENGVYRGIDYFSYFSLKHRL